MFTKILIANRGAISCRIQRTLRSMNIKSVAIYSEADRESRHVLEADEAWLLSSYLDQERIIEIAKESESEAIHPGYGFLSENASFSQACEDNGIVFLGPTPEQAETCGLKHVCRDIAKKAGVPLLEGSELLETADAARAAAERVGFPVIIKSSAGGGGIGMQIARTPDEVTDRFEQVQHLSQSNFSDSNVFLERYVERARHIEVQIFGDGEGEILTLGERDCSVQRRNQKVIEETPAPGLTDEDRARLHEAAVGIAKSVNYRSAGTIEFLWDEVTREFFFLEVNARLQVEHGVTEEVWGVDLVEWMVRLGDGVFPRLERAVPEGHAIQARIYAEDPNRDFQPSTGLITHFQAPKEGRCDTWVESGTEVSSLYDPMVAKVIAHQPTREEALDQLGGLLDEFVCAGIETNVEYVRQILASDEFAAAEITTGFLNGFSYEPMSIDVLDPGLEATVQDYPGRVGMWDVGVPPSGPFDSLSFRVGNLILGNPAEAAGLEIAVRGGRYRFNSPLKFCLTGADMGATLDGRSISPWTAIEAKAGSVLKLGGVVGKGQRTYLTVSGGIDVPEYLGSRATFRMGRFGGHGGRALLPGDVLHVGEPGKTLPREPLTSFALGEGSTWDVRVVYGPHGAPEFFTDEDIGTFFEANWEVHYNSDRTGIRLIGPKPQWARRDGGEAGLHPSNIHDNAYCVGSVDFTGDMPILLGPDGPSLGGFVCPVVVAQADLWKMGQMKPGDEVRFHAVSLEDAEHLLEEQEELLKQLDRPKKPVPGVRKPVGSPILARTDDIVYRRSGDGVILVEFGDLILDLDLRFRAQALYEHLTARRFDGLLELVPGIRSLQVQFDPSIIRGAEVLDRLQSAVANLPDISGMEFPSRIVHLPLSWDDPATREAIDRYMQIVREDAPWCPSNIEFIRRINGLDSVETVRKIVYDASYLVMGLGDVYLGAPVATPLDPRHRLVTTKYNPARTWTPENAVGIGGAYLCIYGMEGPGGYQFVGRTLPIWNRFRTTDHFEPGKPWLLRFFDQIRWYPVDADELLDLRQRFLTGQFDIEDEETTFRPADYHRFLQEHDTEIAAFRQTQQQAFAEERERWEQTGAMSFEVIEPEMEPPEEVTIPEGCEPIPAPLAGTVWKIPASPGDEIALDDSLLVLESMKMEIFVKAPEAGRVREILVSEGATVQPGQILALIEPHRTPDE